MIVIVILNIKIIILRAERWGIVNSQRLQLPVQSSATMSRPEAVATLNLCSIGFS